MNHKSRDKPRAIVVDDSISYRNLLRFWLCPRFEVADFGGANGVPIGDLEECRLAVIDFHLPGIDGGDLARQLRERYDAKRLSIIVVSADPSVKVSLSLEIKSSIEVSLKSEMRKDTLFAAIDRLGILR